MKSLLGPLTSLCAALILIPAPRETRGDVIDDQMTIQQPATLEWDPILQSSDEPVDSRIIGYELEYNREGSTVWNRNGMYRTPEAALPVLKPGGWYFRVVGVLANGIRTAASNTIYVWLA